MLTLVIIQEDLYETKTWLTKAHNRNLIPDESFESFNAEIDTIGIKLNNYIKSIGNTTKWRPAGQMTMNDTQRANDTK